MVSHAATEIISGLAYLHQTGIAHGDLKTANILVSNQHYSFMSVESQDLHEIYHERPIVCKLTDFGESWSLFIQTQLLISSKATTVDRGTVVYTSPELLVEEKCLMKASIADLIITNVWALRMVIFTLLNPSLESPYILEMRAEGVRTQEQLKKFITKLLRKEELPQHNKKYIDCATVWFALEEVFRGCLNFNREKRLSLQEAAQILARRHDRFSMDFQVINLRVSQATALEHFDQKVAVDFQEQVKSLQPNVMPINDGTNACIFLSIGIVESIIQELEREVFEKLPTAVESIFIYL